MNNQRRKLLQLMLGTAFIGLCPIACNSSEPNKSKQIDRFIQKPDYWKGKVPNDAFKILFNEDTERPYSSLLNDEKHEGTFICAACYQPLFLSNTKYDSGTGWPSFFDHIQGSISTKEDHQLLITRTEYHCSRCGGHQGHVFEDGPQPTGLRYCNNGLALNFVSIDEKLSELRG